MVTQESTLLMDKALDEYSILLHINFHITSEN